MNSPKAALMDKDIQSSKKKENPADNLFWVGIGASAGGLEALRSLVQHLPENAPLTYIIAQHLSPQHRSMLPQLIERETSLSVMEVKDGMIPKANVVYITPPSKDVIVSNGKLHLRKPSSETAQPKPSVDKFFTSLSEELEDYAIGIILSGTGSDGSHGIKAIRAQGGITIAQDENSAKYYGMPGSAIETGGVDLILSPDEIGQKLSVIIQSPRSFDDFKTIEEHGGVIESLLHKVRLVSGIDFQNYKPNTIHRRIERRMKARGYTTVEEYSDFACQDDQELRLLFKDLLISVTSFFRDKDAFDSLKNIIEEIVASKSQGETFRIWVPGCCTGEEVYSIAILVAEACGGLSSLSEQMFQIFATDVDETALELARHGVYPEAILEDVHSTLRARYFSYNHVHYEVIKPLRDRIVFSRHNVTEDPPFLRMDLISCRNLLIYFDQNLQQKVLNLFHYALSHKGYLFLGKSETAGSNLDLFQTIDQKEKIFRRKIKVGATYKIPGIMHPTQTRLQTEIIRKEESDIKALSDALVEAMAPHSMIVNENLDIKRVYGDIKVFSTFEAGDTKMNVSTLIDNQYRQEIRALVFKTIRQQKRTTGQERKIKVNDFVHKLNIQVFPLRIQDTNEKLLLVAFHLDKTKEQTLTEQTSKVDDPRFYELEQELTSTREHLQTVIEELETSNEELQSLNEELQSSNEELQSTNEELETSNEELQSTNEELTTVNEELHVKSSQLTLINEDLDNVMESLRSPLLVVDRHLRITRFNKKALEIFDLPASNKSEIITSIPSHIALPTLRKDIMQVIENNKALQTDVSNDNIHYALQIEPYRDIHKTTKGAILVFVDQTALVQKEKLISQAEAFKQLIMDTIPDLIFVKDKDFNIIEANEALKKLYRPDDRNQIIGSTTADQYDNKEAEKFLEQDKIALSKGYAETHETIKFPNGESKTLHTIKVGFTDNNEKFLLGIARDITDILKTERELRKLTYTKEAFIDSSGDGFWDWDLKNDYEYMSPRFWEIFGYDYRERRHHPSEWQKLIFEEDLKRALENFEKHVQSRGKHPYEQQARYKHKDGSTVYVLCKGKVVEWDDQGNALRMIGTHTDITPLKQIQEKLAIANDELSQFAYRTSHDLRSPIISSISLLDYARKKMTDENPEEALKPLNLASSSLKKLEALIADILRLITSEGYEKKPECFNVTEMINDILEPYLLNEEYKQIEIIKHVKSQEIITYKYQFQTILENLLTNALKYHDPKKQKPQIHITVADEKNVITLSVKDNGLGVPEKYQDKLFKMFNRLHKNKAYGSGLGLYLVQKVAHSINGKVSFVPHKNGSEFILKIIGQKVNDDDQET